MFSLSINYLMDIWDVWDFLTLLYNACLGFCVDINFHFSYIYNRNIFAGSYGNSMFELLRNFQTIFQSGYTILYSYKAMVFPVVMYGCESWTIKKAEHRRIDAFEVWCWRTLLRVPWIARRSNQSFLKEISPEYSLEGQILKLKLQYFNNLMQRTDSSEKTLMLGKSEGKWRRG